MRFKITVKVDLKHMMMLTLIVVLPMTVDAQLSVGRGMVGLARFVRAPMPGVDRLVLTDSAR